MSDLLSERVDGALVLTLNRPDKRNALSLELLARLEEELEKAAEDSSLRAVVLTGAGNKSFCAGIDLGVLFEHLSSNPSGEKIRKVQRRLQELFTRLEELEKPTVAAIEGTCVGGGFELALACDFRIASSESKFGFPEAKIGMLPDLGRHRAHVPAGGPRGREGVDLHRAPVSRSARARAVAADRGGGAGPVGAPRDGACVGAGAVGAARDCVGQAGNRPEPWWLAPRGT